MDELNAAIAEQVVLVNGRRFGGQPISLRALFEELEKPALQRRWCYSRRCPTRTTARHVRSGIAGQSELFDMLVGQAANSVGG
jgi:hypothetical protein